MFCDAAVGTQCRPAVPVDVGPLVDRCPVEQVDDVALDVVELVAAEHTGEDVEAVLLVGVTDGRVEVAAGVEADRAAIAERGGAGLALASVAGHVGLDLAVVDDRDLDQRQRSHG